MDLTLYKNPFPTRKRPISDHLNDTLSGRSILLHNPINAKLQAIKVSFQILCCHNFLQNNNLPFYCHCTSRDNVFSSKHFMQSETVQELLTRLKKILYEFLKHSKLKGIKVKMFYHNLILSYQSIYNCKHSSTKRIRFFKS